MPVPWTGAKAEQRYNVTTDFPSLGLHAACATGNVGGVEFALARGQPVNSVLDGVLPIHVAASGGSERVVRLLIDHGADVNALRLPRRYSNDKTRDASSVIIGASNSTPLHFAAANGKLAVVRLLLQHGAHANRPDKHGVTPELVARQNGHEDCAEELRSWSRKRDKDLLEREPPVDDDENGSRRRIHMKRSVDTALSVFKGGSTEALRPPPMPSTSTNSSTPPGSPMRPFGEYTFYPTSPSPSPIDYGSRRPSLPQITHPTPPSVNRKASLASRTNPRRPRSAGNGAEPETTQFGRGGAGRKLGSKYSLLNMFKKGQVEEDGQPVSATAGLPSALSSSSSVALPQTSVESSPGPSSAHLPENPSPSFIRRPSNLSPSMKTQPLPGAQKSPTRPPMAVDLHNAFALHQHRERSGSGTGTPFEAAAFLNATMTESGSPGSLSRLNVLRPGHVRDRSGSRGSSRTEEESLGRPGILRAHNRSISGPAPPAVRALRFDPTSDANGRRADSPSRITSSTALRGSTSAGSLSRLRNDIAEDRDLPDSAPAAVTDFDLEALEKHFLEDDEEDEYAYGRPLPNSRLAIIAASRQQIPSPLQSTGLPFSIRDPPESVPPDVRARGASVSSTSTTDSQTNPQLSASGTTSGSGSVAVMTPLQPTESLPTQTISQPEDVVVESDRVPTSRLSERRTPTPLDINLSLISSHAQAEALVKKELKDILDMPALSPDTTKTPGWTPLSARLAAYGESLELERKFRAETTPATPINEETPTALHPNRQNDALSGGSVGRQNSFDARPRKRRKEPQRPHTSSGTDSTSTESVHTHYSSQSTSAVSSTTDVRAVPMVAQTAATAAKVVQANHRVRRARTPDPEAGLSRVSSLELESIDTELGPALTRVSTAPIPPTQNKRDLARHIASANKLTRMGFPPSQQTKQETAQTKRFGLKSFMQSWKGKP
ncbi:hypothetical protein MIND_00038000 [Mycena indigotica]|uniref:Ankyrin n=1 Tax=Mycena indigotica TaxID=2126181 RepID=A0A8H6TEG2_9AGAR|nr:uncharacterized protein MIND_00038000 [Mycena indigotica]KAF7315236.1 hypothetical protein MIND_00038000 [Mycena indigotica]